jgi:predicted CXXCH cytochrome family protein
MLMNEPSIADQCRKCHADLSKHLHPVTSDKPTPDGTPLTCTSCHDPHSAEHEGLLRFDGKRDLCVQCHETSMTK